MSTLQPHTRRSLPSVIKPFLCTSALLGTGFLAYGVMQQNEITTATHHADRPNPWRGLPGCVVLKDHQTNGSSYWRVSAAASVACGQYKAIPGAALAIGQSEALLSALRPITHEPNTSKVVGNDGTHAAQEKTINGKTIAQGRDVTVTLDARRQPIAQQLADCMTANGACPVPDGKGKAPAWPDRFEGAAARMFAIVDIDIATGEVRALASAHSPCYAQHWAPANGQQAQAATDCPAMPAIKQPQPWRLDNHALYTTWMMGSIDKPWLMLTLLRGPEGAALQQGLGKAWVLNTLKTSNSEALFDRVLCADKGFPADCKRIQGLARAAYDLGLGGGQIALVPTQTDGDSTLKVPNARLMMQQTAQGWSWMPERMPNVELLRKCAAHKYRVCAGEDVANLLAEFWGQGNSQATALSAAAMAARLGAAANGQPAGTPHLVSEIGGKDVSPSPTKPDIARAHAALITQGMGLTHKRGGTANAACAAVLNTRDCEQIDFVAGKTGTPAFAHDKLTLAARAQRCQGIEAQLQASQAADKRPDPRTVAENARCAMQPYKWYVALVKDDPSPVAPFTRAIAVLAERNWRLNGQVDSAGDRGVNVAAEMAFRYIAATHAKLAPQNLAQR